MRDRRETDFLNDGIDGSSLIPAEVGRVSAHGGARIAKGIASVAPGLNAGLERGAVLLVRLTWKEAHAFGGTFVEG